MGFPYPQEVVFYNIMFLWINLFLCTSDSKFLSPLFFESELIHAFWLKKKEIK